MYRNVVSRMICRQQSKVAEAQSAPLGQSIQGEGEAMDFLPMLERTYRDEYRTQARTRGRHRFVLAGPFWQGILISFGFAGITLPWRSIYLLPRYFYHHRLRLHELAHIEQIDRDGPILFIIKITYFLLRYGYRNSPYEIEARAAEDGAQLDMFEGVTLTQDKTYGSARRHSI